MNEDEVLEKILTQVIAQFKSKHMKTDVVFFRLEVTIETP